MGAILEHFPHLRYPGSRSSLNLGNPEAVAFGLALAEQYAAYFAGRGCRFFNFCADEFANDLGTMGLDLIYHNGDMKHFVSFVNGLAERIAQNGMVPMAFNDGIYYHDDKETYGTIDSWIWVQYWIAGWEGLPPCFRRHPGGSRVPPDQCQSPVLLRRRSEGLGEPHRTGPRL